MMTTGTRDDKDLLLLSQILHQIQTIPPWTMCTEEEAKERSRFGASEVSIFECDPNVMSCFSSSSSSSSLRSLKNSSSLQRRIQCSQVKRKAGDSRLFVQKYRRSAAATGTVSKNTSFQVKRRSLEDLEMTVHHLIFSIFCHRVTLACFCTCGYANRSSCACTCNISFTVYDVVEFVHDRLRAVQVDLTSGRYLDGSPRVTLLLARMIRYYIMAGYLLSDNSKFDMKLHSQQINSCMSLFKLNLSGLGFIFDNPDLHTIDIIDEILCYSLLLSQLGQHKEEKSFSIELKNVIEQISFVSNECNKLSLFPRVKWCIDVIVAYQNNLDYEKFFKCLMGDCHWKLISRALLIRALNYTRSMALTILNKSLMKGEKVSEAEVARLVRMETKKSNKLCENMNFSFEINSGVTRVIFKLSPVDIYNGNSLRDDAFVLCNLRVTAHKKCYDKDGVALLLSTDQLSKLLI